MSSTSTGFLASSAKLAIIGRFQNELNWSLVFKMLFSVWFLSLGYRLNVHAFLNSENIKEKSKKIIICHCKIGGNSTFLTHFLQNWIFSARTFIFLILLEASFSLKWWIPNLRHTITSHRILSLGLLLYIYRVVLFTC